MISFSCISCHKILSVKDELAGMKVTCPGCQQVVGVPQAAVTPASQDKPSSANVDEERNLPPSVGSQANIPTLPPQEVDADGKDSLADADGESPLGSARPGEITHSLPAQGPSREFYDFLAPAQQPDEIGRLGPFRVLQVLGAGGMGVVYKAEDPQLQRPVALKAMLPTLAVSDTARKRFLREAQAAAAIVHDHIVRILQVGEDRGVPFLAMQFLEGESLDARLKRQPLLAMAEVLRIGRETATGLAAAHQRGLIHRDIKPANLWLEGDKGRLKILDFGLARAAADDDQLTQSGAIIGTPAYMAPEQAAGEKVDQRCDLFSLGSVLYRLCTGTMPFRAKDTISTLIAVATQTPPRPGAICPEVPPQLSDLVMRLLAKKPEQRPESAQVVAEALRQIEEQTPATTAKAARTQPLRSANKPWPWLVGGVLGLGAVGILLFFLLRPSDDGASPERQPPESASPAAKDAVTARVVVGAAAIDKIREVPSDGLTSYGKVEQTDAKVAEVITSGKSLQMPCKLFQVKLSAGKKYRIAMDSKDFDCYLLVRDQVGHNLAWDDDSGDDLNALLTLDVLKDGVYKIYAASYKGQGNFTLYVKEVGAIQVHEVGSGLTLKGELGKGEAITYNVKLLAGKTYVIDMISPNQAKLDPFLRLLGADGKELAQDDDGGENLNARISYQAPDTGIHQIVATYAAGHGQGPFTLTVREDATK